MAKKKINLLFDATIIMNAYDKKQTCRSGIFFVALNVLKELEILMPFMILLSLKLLIILIIYLKAKDLILFS